MSKLRLVLIILGVIVILIGAGFLVNRFLTKGETQKHSGQNYYWTITTNRTSLKGALSDELKIFTPDNKLIFDSDSVKPFFDEAGNPKISIATDQTKDGMTFKQTFTYSFAQVNVLVALFNNQKYADISTEIKYSQDKTNQFEGIELALDGGGQTSYLDETYQKKNLSGKAQISPWSPHILEIGSKYKATLTDYTAEVMELQKTIKNTNIKFYSYYGPTREGVFARNYDGADKAEPKIDTKIKRAKDETVNLSARLFISQESLSYLPFRYPYAKDSVVSYTSHADLGSIKDIDNDTINRIKTVFMGASDQASPDWGKKGILAHNLRVTMTIFPVNDDSENDISRFSTLETPAFQEWVTEIYRRGIDIGVHRLTYSGIGEVNNPKAKIKLAFELIKDYTPTVWIDHRVSDCVTEPKQENIAGCGSLKGNKLNVTNELTDGTWKYLWASGQDSQANGPDYQLNAFEKFQDAARILYYYQGASNALIPPKLLTFASSYTHSSEELTESELDQLAKAKGFINIHTYFLDNSEQNDASALKKTNQGTFWKISNHLENGLKLLGEYQDEDKIWVRDFTTVADYLRAWHNIKILDFTKDSVTIQNEGDQNIDGLTLYNPAGKIATAKTDDTYYPYIRDNYVVLSRLEKGGTRTITFGDDANIPQITNFTDKHIDISDVSYDFKEKTINISIASSGKPGQDLVIGNTDIKIKLPDNITPRVTRDGQAYTNFTVKGKELTITSDTHEHNFEIQL